MASEEASSPPVPTAWPAVRRSRFHAGLRPRSPARADQLPLHHAAVRGEDPVWHEDPGRLLAWLFEDRSIIFLGVQVDDASADDVMAQLLVSNPKMNRDVMMWHQLTRRFDDGHDRHLRHHAVHQA